VFQRKVDEITVRKSLSRQIQQNFCTKIADAKHGSSEMIPQKSIFCSNLEGKNTEKSVY